MKSKHEQKFFKKEDAKDDSDLSEAFKRVQVKPLEVPYFHLLQYKIVRSR